jgi:NADP-dependent 3-hydroxy acid dehydrogenase YdfG
MNQNTRAKGVAVVTGAAGSMGKATARALFDTGWADLLLCDLQQDALEALAASLRSEGAAVSIYAGDVADPAWPAGLIAGLAGPPVSTIVRMAGLGPNQGDPARVIDVTRTWHPAPAS